MTLKERLGLPMNVVPSLFLENCHLVCSTSLRTNRIFLNAHQGFPMGEEDKRLVPGPTSRVQRRMFLNTPTQRMVQSCCSKPPVKWRLENSSCSLYYGLQYKCCYEIFSPASSFHLERKLGEIHKVERG